MNKMIKKPFILISSLLMLTLIFNGCDDEWMEITPKDGVFESTVWSSTQNANLFLNDIYRSMPTDAPDTTALTTGRITV